MVLITPFANGALKGKRRSIAGVVVQYLNRLGRTGLRSRKKKADPQGAGRKVLGEDA